MRFIIDQQLPPALVGWLTGKGHEASHVHLRGLGSVDDGDIWQVALQEGSIVVTKDLDFAERRQRAASGPAILWLRVGNTTNTVLFAAMERVWPQVEAALAAGSTVVEVR